jgi:hypothetical protein
VEAVSLKLRACSKWAAEKIQKEKKKIQKEKGWEGEEKRDQTPICQLFELRIVKYSAFII